MTNINTKTESAPSHPHIAPPARTEAGRGPSGYYLDEVRRHLLGSRRRGLVVYLLTQEFRHLHSGHFEGFV